MKRILIFLAVFLIAFSFSACGQNSDVETREAVEINLPKDNSVNGYRTGEADNSDKTIVRADEVAIDTSPTVDNSNNFNTNNYNGGSKYNSKKETNTGKANYTGGYCLNINSKIYHKESCGSVSTMKEENKAFFSDRNEAVQGGYKPCKRCNP